MNYEKTTTLELIAQVGQCDPMTVDVSKAAAVDSLLRAHQAEVRGLEERLREQVRAVLFAERRQGVIDAVERFAQRGRRVGGRGA